MIMTRGVALMTCAFLVASTAMHPAVVASDALPAALPEELVPSFAEAVTAYERQEFQRALESYDDILSIPHLAQRWNIHARFGKALSHKRLGELDAAQGILTSILQETAIDRRLAGRALRELGEVNRQAGHYDEALQLFQQVYDTFPDLSGMRIWALYGMSLTYIAQGDRARFYEVVEGLQRDYPYAIMARVHSKSILLKGALAFEDYERVIAVGEATRAQILQHAAALQKSIPTPVVRKLERLTHLALANAYVSTGQFDLARDAYQAYLDALQRALPAWQQFDFEITIEKDARLDPLLGDAA